MFIVQAAQRPQSRDAGGLTIEHLIDIRHPSNAVWSPDGRLIVFGRGGQLFEVHADGGGLTQLSMPGSNYTADWATAAPPPPPPPDTTPPQIFVTLPADGSSWLLGQRVASSYQCDW